MEQVQVIHGDALAILPTLEAGSVDCVITDPPFSERTHVGARSFMATGRASQKGFGNGDGVRSLVDFSAIDEAGFIRLCREFVRVARRWVVLTCDWRHAAAAETAGLPLIRCGVWIKPDSAPQFTGDRPGTGWEAVAILHREGKKQWNGGGLPAVWTFGRDRSGLHPSIKPLPLIKEWIRLFTDPGETILDPFAGSGVTGVAALKTGRCAILIESDSRYIPVIHRRLAEAATPLFAEP